MLLDCILCTNETKNNKNQLNLFIVDKSSKTNGKIKCNENGKESSLPLTMELQTIKTSIELPVSWKPAIQQVTIQRDSWDHKIEFLLAVIGILAGSGSLYIKFFKNFSTGSSRRLIWKKQGSFGNFLICNFK